MNVREEEEEVISMCRNCGMYEETLAHVLNCYTISSHIVEIDHQAIYVEADVRTLGNVASMVRNFMEYDA